VYDVFTLAGYHHCRRCMGMHAYTDAAYCYVRSGVVCLYVYVVSVSVFVTAMSLAKTAEPIKMPLGKQTRVGLRNHVLDGGSHWRHMANMIDRSVMPAAATRTYRYHHCSNLL